MSGDLSQAQLQSGAVWKILRTRAKITAAQTAIAMPFCSRWTTWILKGARSLQDAAERVNAAPMAVIDGGNLVFEAGAAVAALW